MFVEIIIPPFFAVFLKWISKKILNSIDPVKKKDYKILLDNKSLLRRLQKLELETQDQSSNALSGGNSVSTPIAQRTSSFNVAASGATNAASPTSSEEEEKNYHKKILQAQREKNAIVEDLLRVTDALQSLEKMLNFFFICRDKN